MIDLPKQNSIIKFVSNVQEIKQIPNTIEQPLKLNVNSKISQQIKELGSENKQQYKRLADAIGKSD